MGKKYRDLSSLQISHKIENEPLQNLIDGSINGSLENVVKLLKRHDFNVNAYIIDQKQTLLINATLKKHNDILKILLRDPRIDVNQPEAFQDQSAINIAAANNYLEGVKLLLSHPEIDVNYKSFLSEETPLIIAVCKNHVDIVKELLKSPKINVNQEDWDHTTAITFASMYGNLECVKNLLMVPAIDVNIGKRNGATALFCAVEDNHLEVVNELLRFKNIDVNKGNNDNETPLSCACKQGFIEITQSLLNHPNIDVNKYNLLSHVCGYSKYIQQSEGRTFSVEGQGRRELEWDATWTQHSTFKLLRIHDVKILQTQVSPSGQTLKVFSRPTISTMCKIIQLLLSHKDIMVDQKDDDGKTPLMHACRYGHAKFVQLLLENGANINFSFKIGNGRRNIQDRTAVIRSIDSEIETAEKLQVLFSRLDLQPNQVSIFQVTVAEDAFLVEGNALIYATLKGFQDDNSTYIKQLFRASSKSTYSFNMDIKWIPRYGDEKEQGNIINFLVQHQKVALVSELFQGFYDQEIKTNQLHYFVEAYPNLSALNAFNSFIAQAVEQEHFVVQRVCKENFLHHQNLQEYGKLWDILGNTKYLENLLAKATNFNVFRSIFVRTAIENQYTSLAKYYYGFFLVNFLLYLCLIISAFSVHLSDQYNDITKENDNVVRAILWATLPLIFLMLFGELNQYNSNFSLRQTLMQVSLSSIIESLVQISTITNILDWFIICVGIALPISWSSKKDSLMSMTSIYIVTLFYRLTLWLLPCKQVGHYILMMILVSKEAIIFVIVIFFTLLFFSLGFLLVFQESDKQQTFDRKFFEVCLGLFGNIDRDHLDEFFELEAPYRQTGIALLAIFIIIVPVLAINLLIALMTRTYEEVSKQQESTYVRNKALMAVEANQFFENIGRYFPCFKQEKKSFNFFKFEYLKRQLGIVVSISAKLQDFMLDNFEKIQGSFNNQFSKVYDSLNCQDMQLKLLDSRFSTLENKLIKQEKIFMDIIDKLNSHK